MIALTMENAPQSTRLVLWGIILANFIRNFAYQVNEIVMARFIPVELNGDSSVYGLVVGVFSFSQFLFMIPLAKWSDQVGRRNILILCYATFSLGMFLFSFVQTLQELIIFRFIHGSGAYAGVVMALINDIFPEGQRGKPIALFTAGLGLGALGGAAFGGLILTTFGFRRSFLFMSLLSLSSIIFVLFMIPAGKAISVKIAQAAQEPLKNNKSCPQPVSFRELVKIKPYLFGFLLAGVANFCFQGMLSFLIFMLMNFFPVPESQAPLFLLPIMVLYIIIVILFGRKEATHRLIKLGLAFLSVGNILFFFLGINSSVWLFIAISSLAGIGFGLLLPSLDNFVSNTVPPSMKGEALGAFKSFAFFCSIFGSIFTGYIGSRFTITSPFIFLGLIMLISLIISMILLPTLSPAITKPEGHQ
jgi:MFS family permease